MGGAGVETGSAAPDRYFLSSSLPVRHARFISSLQEK
jgi:hypothetical protein